MPLSAIAPENLAAALAARLLHDLAGPATGVAAGMELHAQSIQPNLGAEGLSLAADSARDLLDLLAFCRAAYGVGAGPHDGRGLERLARTQFAGRRARLIWSTPVDRFGDSAARATLILLQIAAGGLGAGGEADFAAEATDRGLKIRVDAKGARARPHPEALIGLAGEPLVDGLPGRWAPAYYLHRLTATAGGSLSAETWDGGFALTAVLPG
jgi:histidine phosphotransferase ChpT